MGLVMLYLKQWPRPVLTLRYGTIREYNLRSFDTIISISANVWLDRNDAAIQKAKDLAVSHNVKASAYKVDGRSVVSIQ